jgi:hypothetical protein
VPPVRISGCLQRFQKTPALPDVALKLTRLDSAAQGRQIAEMMMAMTMATIGLSTVAITTGVCLIRL